MDHFDDIVIGSGLSALGTVLGLSAKRRVLVLGGAAQGVFAHYDALGAVPAAYTGLGGLGGYWHGVIPLNGQRNFGVTDPSVFPTLFNHFYPRVDIQSWMGRQALFVPWKPIRPNVELTKLVEERAGALRLVLASAQSIQIDADGQASVQVQDGATVHSYRAPRVWIAAGALHTPDLLARSFGEAVRLSHVSDHVLCYVGHVDRRGDVDVPRTQLSREGVFFPSFSDKQDTALYTLRPARFAFRQLDHGIEQRAAFGLPTGGAIAKIMRSMSLGLLTEAFYNRFGLLARASRYSIYAQTPVEGAYALGEGATPLKPDLERIQAAATLARQRQPFAGATISRRADLYIPGIHLHQSLNMAALHQAGVNRPGDAVQVIDASNLSGIGPEHHSFKMLCAAWQRARMSQ